MAEINDIIENEDNENLGIDDVEGLVNPEVPDTIDNQQLTVYMPLATGDTPGIAKFDKDHFVLKDGNVKLLNPSAGGSSTTNIDLPLEKGTGKNSFQQKSSVASEESSTALGVGTQSTGLASFSAGIGTRASVSAQSSFGTYNSPNPKALLIVGNGSASRWSNALEVLNNGKLNFDKSEFSKVVSGEVNRVLTIEGGTQVAKITMSFGFVPNAVFVRSKNGTGSFNTAWINSYDSNGNYIPMVDNTLSFTFSTDKGTEFTYVAIAADTVQVSSGGSGGNEDVEDPDTGGDAGGDSNGDSGGDSGSSETISITIDGNTYPDIPVGTTWEQFAKDKDEIYTSGETRGENDPGIDSPYIAVYDDNEGLYAYVKDYLGNIVDSSKPITQGDYYATKLSVDGEYYYCFDAIVSGASWYDYVVSGVYNEFPSVDQDNGYILDNVDYTTHLLDGNGSKVKSDAYVMAKAYYLEDTLPNLISFTLDGETYYCPYGKTWKYLTDNGIIPISYAWLDGGGYPENDPNTTGGPYTLWYSSGSDYIIYYDSNGKECSIYPEDRPIDGEEYGGWSDLEAPPYVLTIIKNSTTEVFTLERFDSMLNWAEGLNLSYENRDENLWVENYGFFSYYDLKTSELKYFKWDTAGAPIMEYTDINNIPLTFTCYETIPSFFKFEGKSYQVPEPAVTWKSWLTEKFPTYEIVTEDPLYIKDKGVIKYDFYGDGSYDEYGNYFDPSSKYSRMVLATDFIGEHTYYLDNNVVVFTVEINSVAKTYVRTKDGLSDVWTDWALSEGYEIRSDMPFLELDVGWLNVSGTNRIKEGYYVLMPYGSYTIYIDDKSYTISEPTLWMDWAQSNLSINVDPTVSPYTIEIPDPWYGHQLYLTNSSNKLVAANTYMVRGVYTFKCRFYINDKEYFTTSGKTWEEWVNELNGDFEISYNRVVNKSTGNILYKKNNAEGVAPIPAVSYETIDGDCVYLFDSKAYINFYIDDVSYRTLTWTSWYEWVTKGEGSEYFELADGYVRHKTTKAYIYSSTGVKIEGNGYIDNGEYYVSQLNTIPTVTIDITPYRQSTKKYFVVGVGSKWKDLDGVSENSITFKTYGEYISIDEGKTYIASAGVRINKDLEIAQGSYECVPAVKFKVVPLGFDYENQETYNDDENTLEDNVLGGTTWGEWLDDNSEFMPPYGDYVSLDGGQSCITDSLLTSEIVDEKTYYCTVIQAPWE